MKKVMIDCTCTFWGSDSAEITDPNMIYDKIIKNFESFSREDDGMILSFWEDDVNISSLTIGVHKNYGICLTHDIYYKKLSAKGEFIANNTHLAVYDKTKLEEVIEIDDEWYASVGLFFPTEIAWKGIKEFMVSGGMTLDIEWIHCSSMPENGNWC